MYVVRQTYPNYDTYYTLVWGKELANGHLPDYDVLRAADAASALDLAVG